MDTSRPSLRPLRLGPCAIRNRIFRPAHEVMLCRAGRITPEFIAYHEARARGGAGLLILESSAVHPSTGYNPKVLRLWDDEAIEGLADLANAVSTHGSHVFAQLWHGGHQSLQVDGSPPWSSTSIPGALLGIAALAMDEAMIDEIITSFAAAALRVKAAGLHGVEVHAAHGYLLRQFLAPALNDRTDRWGGSFENRARFILDIMRAIRAAVGSSIAVGIRLGPETPQGFSDIGEIKRLVGLIEAEGLADFIGLSPGEIMTAPGLIAAGMEQPAGYQLPGFDDISDNTALPLLVTGRFRSLDETDSVLRDGKYDMVGMVRAMMADQDLIAKSVDGHAEQIRPCIGCNQLCTAGIPIGDVKCAVNTSMGREDEFRAFLGSPHTHVQRVLIVGGGIAGMETARLAALRGHQVVLCEARPDLGGLVKFAARLGPRMASFGDIAHWLEADILRLGVEIRSSTYIDVEDIDAVSFDCVVVATGAGHDRAPLFQRWEPGANLDAAAHGNVLSAEEALETVAAKRWTTSLVYDDVGHYEAIAVAEALVLNGSSVSFATPYATFAPKIASAGRAAPALRRLSASGRFRLLPNTIISALAAGQATLSSDRTGGQPETVNAEVIVMVGHRSPAAALIRDIKALGLKVHAVGDALSPRFIESAMLDAYRAVQAIDQHAGTDSEREALVLN